MDEYHSNLLSMYPKPFLQIAALILAWSLPAVAAELKIQPGIPKWTKSTELKSLFVTNSIAEIATRAESGNVEAQHYLGFLYYTGDGVTKDVKLARNWFLRAATNGFALSQNNLGSLYANGEGVESNLTAAVEWFQHAAQQGLPLALSNLGQLALENKGGLRSEDAHRFFQSAAERGDMKAAFLLGKVDQERGIYWMTLAAENGEVSAYSHLGWFYMDGWRVPRDFAQAKKWFEKGAAVNDPHCQLSLGVYELKTKDKPDLALARSWMLKAAEQKLVGAYFHLGVLSELRDIPHKPSEKPDYVEATKWYRLAAGLNDRQAARRLVELAEEGLGETSDVVAALRMASDLNDYNSRFELALRLWRGEAEPITPNENPELLAQSAAGARSNIACQLSDLYRTGQHVKKDLLESLRLLHFDSVRSYGAARERIASLRDAVKGNGQPAPTDQELLTVFPLYMEAVLSKAAEPAARIGRHYLDGTYPKNDIAATVWFSLAAARGDREAEKELQRMLSKLDERSRLAATQQTTSLQHAPSLLNH